MYTREFIKELEAEVMDGLCLIEFSELERFCEDRRITGLSDRKVFADIIPITGFVRMSDLLNGGDFFMRTVEYTGIRDNQPVVVRDTASCFMSIGIKRKLTYLWAYLTRRFKGA